MSLIVPIERTWAPGDSITAARLNSNVRDAVNFLVNPPLFVGEQHTAQSIANITWTAVTLDTSIVDSYNGYSTTVNPSRYTAAVSGWYSAGGAAYFAANATGIRAAAVYVNGAVILRSLLIIPNAGTSRQSVGTIPGLHVFLNANDYAELWVYQSSGAALGTQPDTASYGSLSMRFVHA